MSGVGVRNQSGGSGRHRISKQTEHLFHYNQVRNNQKSQGTKHRITQRIGLGNWRQVGNRTKLSLTQELVVLIS